MIDFFFFQAQDGIRDRTVTGVQTCALPILCRSRPPCPGVVEPSGKCLEICLIVYVDQGGGQVDKERSTHRGGRSWSRHTCRRAREGFSALLSPGERPEDAHAGQWIGSSNLPGYRASSWRTDMG